MAQADTNVARTEDRFQFTVDTLMGVPAMANSWRSHYYIHEISSGIRLPEPCYSSTLSASDLGGI